MIDAADFKQYIFPLLFFKRVSDIWDEEYQEALELSDGDIAAEVLGRDSKIYLQKSEAMSERV
jgi:type I restriction-modification system DNA methylase subunit